MHLISLLFFELQLGNCFSIHFVGGRVLTWGRGTSGQLGHGDMVNSLYPKLVASLQAYLISHVSAGWSHSGFVSGGWEVIFESQYFLIDSCC